MNTRKAPFVFLQGLLSLGQLVSKRQASIGVETAGITVRWSMPLSRLVCESPFPS